MHPRAPFLLGLALAGCSEPPPLGDDDGDLVAASESSGDGTDTGRIDDGSTGEPDAPDACADACLDRTSREGAATCHSCRCKAAFDDWLPSVDELQCSHGEPIVTYHAELSDTGYALEPTGPGAIRCANPSLLTGSCRQGSRLGRLTHDDVSVAWICRDPYLDLDGSVMFHDMAIIGHNTRTGATCFWDDIDDVMHEDDVPPLDLVEATAEERQRSAELFPRNDGNGCVTCHDHDPFLYTPHLQSTSWQSLAADGGPYHLVGLDGVARPTGVMHLVSPQASACTSCHRLGSKETCTFFAPDSLASDKLDAYESPVHAASEPGSPYWELAYWMPGGTHAFDDFAAWEAMFGEARAHVLECCEAPGEDVGDCRWAPVPAQ